MPPRPTARDLGIPFDGEPGPYNAITDVPGVEVGHTTIIKGEGPLVIGKGPVRTGVTAILPLGRQNLGPVPAAWFPFNGNGEMTGTTWIEESGFLEGPILLTNTTSVGTVRDAVIKWLVKQHQAAGRFNPNDFSFSLPVVAETWDGWLNDAFGFHVTEADVVHALETAASGPVAQGNVGGGTGMVAYDFKGGIGTSSRVVRLDRDSRASSPSPSARPELVEGTGEGQGEGGEAKCYGRSPDRAMGCPLGPSEGLRSSGATGRRSVSAVGQCGPGDQASGVGSQESDVMSAGSLASRSPEDAAVVSRSPDHDTTLPSPESRAPSPYVVGVLVQANHGKRPDLLIRGVPVGRELPLSEIPRGAALSSPSPLTGEGRGEGVVPSPEPQVPSPFSARSGSILIIIATNAPLLPHQLKRLARRATLGLARTGTIGNNDSGDLFLAFSTAWGPFAERGLSPFPMPGEESGTVPFSSAQQVGTVAFSPPSSPSPSARPKLVEGTGEGHGEGEVGVRQSGIGSQESVLGSQKSEAGGEAAAVPSPEPLASSPYFIANDEIDPFFAATVEATEEAILNALVAAETLTGRDNLTAAALPHARLQEIIRTYNRINQN